MRLDDQHILVHENKTSTVQRLTEVTIVGIGIVATPVELRPGDKLSIHVRRGGRRFSQHNGREEATRFCPCGSSFTWAGLDERLDKWVSEHRAHVDSDAIDEY